MRKNKRKTFLHHSFLPGCLPFYLAGLVVILGIKYFYSKAHSNDLEWILSPTAWWAGILSGLRFERAPGMGYVNHEARFIIAASCSGIQFMIVTIATLIFSFVHRMGNGLQRLCWSLCSLLFSCFFTVLVNGLRITAAIYLPLFLKATPISPGWLTPDQLHTIIGVVSYFTALLLLYQAAGILLRPITDKGMEKNTKKEKHPAQSFYPAPLFWYFFITLGIPFLNKAYQNNPGSFGEYAILTAAVSIGILLLFGRGTLLFSRLPTLKAERNLKGG